MNKKVGNWGGSRSVRLETECRDMGIKQGDIVSVTINNGRIVIEKLASVFKTADNANLELASNK